MHEKRKRDILLFMTRKLPIGISDFKKIIEGDYAYADKTLLVQELMEKGAESLLIPRMRRFGKTLNLSMLRYFFEKTAEDNSHLFKNLNIWKLEKYRDMQGKFPVVFITLKDVKCDSWTEAGRLFREVMASEYERHRYLLEGDTLSSQEKEKYLKIMGQESDQSLLECSLILLTGWLHRYHKTRAVLLIDEYDTPVHAAYMGKYYLPMIHFLRNWLSAGLKDNIHLEKGVLTGVLRIAKESLFSGLNNVSTFTILNESFQDKFGLLEHEVKQLLEEYDLSSKLPEIRQWYNGYRIGSCTGIYNPWSVLKCIESNGATAAYWVNTSDNALMKELIAQGADDLKADVEELLRGKTVKKHIEEKIVFPDLEKSSEAVWSLLLFSGYLTIDATPSYGIPCELRIPNTEVEALYRSMILEWFNTTMRENKYRMFLQSLATGDVETFSEIFQEFMLSSASMFDVTSNDSEKIYHAVVLGMMIGLKDTHEVKSNRESGLGRYDVMLIPKNPKELGVIMEFKKVSQFKKVSLEEAVTAAMKQIEDKRYAQELQSRGIHRILSMGFAFEGKNVLIAHKFND
jgi:hypothetical protein